MRGKVCKLLKKAAAYGDNKPSYKELKALWQTLSHTKKREVRTWGVYA